MGQTFNIACDECRVTLWVGQDIGYVLKSTYIYGGNHAFPRAEYGETHSPLAEFLIRHVGHPLRFLSDNSDHDEEYLSLSDSPGLPPDDFQSGILAPIEGDPQRLTEAKADYARRMAAVEEKWQRR